MRKLALKPILFRIEFLESTFKYVEYMFKQNNRANFEGDIKKSFKFLGGLSPEEYQTPIQIWVPSNAVWNRGHDDIKEVEDIVKRWGKAMKLDPYVWSGHGYFLK